MSSDILMDSFLVALISGAIAGFVFVIFLALWKNRKVKKPKTHKYDEI